jgi:hypothetical protein
MAEFLAEKRKEIAKRLDELRPAVDEYQRLEAAAKALDSVNGPRATPRRGPGRPPGSRTRAKQAPSSPPAGAASRKRAGRRRGSGPRGAESLALVEQHPGITIPELAAKMGIKQNYLYRVLPGLEQEGKVEKKGRGWHPKKTPRRSALRTGKAAT